MGDLSATNLTALALLALIIMWAIKVAVPLLVKDRSDTTQAFINALEENRKYHREDKDAMRKFMAYELSEQRKSIAGLSRAIERNTVAMQAAVHAEDIEAALKKFTNGESSPPT